MPSSGGQGFASDPNSPARQAEERIHQGTVDPSYNTQSGPGSAEDRRDLSGESAQEPLQFTTAEKQGSQPQKAAAY